MFRKSWRLFEQLWQLSKVLLLLSGNTGRGVSRRRSRAVDVCNLHDTLHYWAQSDSGSVEQMAGRGHDLNRSISHALPQQWTQNRSQRHLSACPCEGAWMEGSTGLGQPAWGNRPFRISCHALVIIEGSSCDGAKPLNTFICISER